ARRSRRAPRGQAAVRPRSAGQVVRGGGAGGVGGHPPTPTPPEGEGGGGAGGAGEDGERGSEEGARPRSHLPYSVVHSRRAVGSGSGVAFARCYCSRPNATTDPPDVKSACTGRKLLSVAAGASRGGPTPCRAFQERRRLRPRAAPPRAASADSSSTQGARPRHHTCGGGAAAPCERW
ncbi:unnamed protein product, partial [Prorocentrum cordatum]